MQQNQKRLRAVRSRRALCVYQFIKKLLIKSKSAAGQVVSVIQMKIQFIQNANIN